MEAQYLETPLGGLPKLTRLGQGEGDKAIVTRQECMIPMHSHDTCLTFIGDRYEHL